MSKFLFSSSKSVFIQIQFEFSGLKKYLSKFLVLLNYSPRVKTLAKFQRHEMLNETSLEKKCPYAENIKIILLIHCCKSLKDNARFLALDEETVENWWKWHEDGGVEKLLNDHYVGNVALLSDKKISIDERLTVRKTIPHQPRRRYAR